MKKEDINIAISVFVAALTIYSTVVVVQTVRKHREELEAKIDGIQNTKA
jgi:hypothetical protein